MGELLPCPFCGSQGQVNDHVLKTMSGHYTADAQCSSCDNVAIDQVYATSREDAVKGAALVWNTRYPETLVWSNERPKVAGYYFVRNVPDLVTSNIWRIDEDDIKTRWVESVEFAGPIPEPKETTE